MNFTNIKEEVIHSLTPIIKILSTKYLKSTTKLWQSSELIPQSNHPHYIEAITTIQNQAKELDDDLLAVLIGDTITEEALPSYQSWLMNMDYIYNSEEESPWKEWIRKWSAEEKRHGSALMQYLYISGRVNIREVEQSTQYLIQDGFDIGTGRDPYNNFIYTSFQELATNISHRRVANLARKKGNQVLGKLCSHIASDEMRHAQGYISIIKEVISLDPEGFLSAFEKMMRHKIVMPAHNLRNSVSTKGELFKHFSDSAQRIKVYTSNDYIDILKSLLCNWNLANITNLGSDAEKSRDYLMALPQKLEKISTRIKIPTAPHKFSWILS